MQDEKKQVTARKNCKCAFAFETIQKDKAEQDECLASHRLGESTVRTDIVDALLAERSCHMCVIDIAQTPGVLTSGSWNFGSELDDVVFLITAIRKWTWSCHQATLRKANSRTRTRDVFARVCGSGVSAFSSP